MKTEQTVTDRLIQETDLLVNQNWDLLMASLDFINTNTFSMYTHALGSWYFIKVFKSKLNSTTTTDKNITVGFIVALWHDTAQVSSSFGSLTS